MQGEHFIVGKLYNMIENIDIPNKEALLCRIFIHFMIDLKYKRFFQINTHDTGVAARRYRCSDVLYPANKLLPDQFLNWLLPHWKKYC